MPAKAMLSISLGFSTVCSLVRSLLTLPASKRPARRTASSVSSSRADSLPAPASRQLTMGARYGCFLRADDLRRQNRPQNLLQNVLLVHPQDLPPRRHSRHEVDHAIVQKRQPDLDGVRHGHSVALRRQQIMAQEDHRFEVLRLAHRVQLAVPFGQTLSHGFVRIRGADRRLELAGEERLDPAGVVPSYRHGRRADRRSDPSPLPKKDWRNRLAF